MPKLTVVNPQKLIMVLERSGFYKARQKGSHAILISNEKHARIVVPVHPGKCVKPGLVRAIIREAGLTREEFLKLLEEV